MSSAAPAGRVRLSVNVPPGMAAGRQLRVQHGHRQYDVTIPPVAALPLSNYPVRVDWTVRLVVPDRRPKLRLGIGGGLSYPLLCSDNKHSGGQWGVECLSV